MTKAPLNNSTAVRQLARIGGVLDTVVVSTRAIVLRLESGKVLRGSALDVPLEQLKRALGCEVVAEGVVALGPSGEAVQIDVKSIVQANTGDGTSAGLPSAEPLPGLDACFGKWPGDETDAQLTEALERT